MHLKLQSNNWEQVKDTSCENLKDPLDDVLSTLAGEPSLGEEFYDGLNLTEYYLENPPSIILCHVYTAPQTTLEEGHRSDGHYVIRGLTEYLDELNKRGKNLPTVLFAGGHASTNYGINICDRYKQAFQNKMDELGVRARSITETQIRSDPHWAHNQLAQDTSGEVEFLKFALTYIFSETGENGGSIMAIGRLPHVARIRVLLKGHNIEAEALSIESLIAYFHPYSVERMFKMYPQIKQKLINFHRRDMIFVRQMKPLDRKGKILRAIAGNMSSKAKEKTLAILDRKSH